MGGGREGERERERATTPATILRSLLLSIGLLCPATLYSTGCTNPFASWKNRFSFAFLLPLSYTRVSISGLGEYGYS